GTGAPVVSLFEDVLSVGMSLVAIVLPALIVVFLAGIVLFFVWVRRRLKRRREAKLAARAAGTAAAGTTLRLWRRSRVTSIEDYLDNGGPALSPEVFPWPVLPRHGRP